MDQSLTSVMRNINDALRLDDDSHDKEAYLKYLDCVLCITCNLQQYVRSTGGDVVITKQVTKQVKLAQQCVDRVAVLVEKIGSTQRPVVLTSPQEEVRAVPARPKPFMVVPPLAAEPSTNTFARAKVNSPMEMAYKQNQQLMAAYKARLKRMNKRDPGAFNLSLTIQRKMAENLAIAKRTEMALAKKMQERQERLEEQAAKRFNTPIGMSQEEQEQRQIYKKILEYEQDAKWLQAWREKLTSSPSEPELICQLIQEILRCRDHPLTLLLKQYQYKIYEKIYPLVVNKRPRLEAVTVPLSQSLWPPELCPTDGKDHLVSGGGLEGEGGVEGEEGREEEDEGIQTDQDPLSPSPSLPEEGAVPEGHADSRHTFDPVKNRGNAGDASSDPDLSPGELSAISCPNSRELDVDSGDSVPVKSTENNSTDTIGCDHDDCGLKSTETSSSRFESQADPTSDAGDVSDSGVESVRIAGDSQHGHTVTADSREEAGSNTPEERNEESAFPPELPSADSMAQVVEDTKENISRAVTAGEQLQTQLKSEQKSAVKILRQITQDYEKYNAENMDDLFDDDDDVEDDETNLSLPDQSTSAQTHNSTEFHQPVSLSVSSQSSFGDTDSGSGSISSTQDFPSLPPGNEDPTEMERMSKEAYQRHLKNISADVHQYMEKLLILFTIAYEQLDCPQGRDQCYASLEETFFKPLWKFLLMLFRLVNYKDEVAVACKMTQKSEAGPKAMGVTDKLCLLPAEGGNGGEGSVQSEAVPYAEAISHLRCIRNHYTMLGKLECVVKVVHLVFDSIKEFYLSQGCAPSDVPSVGADDLLPVMSYVVMQSALPQLVSECAAMAEFIHEGYMMGQEGYCLTTLETAVSFIVSSDLSDPLTPT